MARLIDADALIKEIVSIDDLRKLSTATIGKALDAVPTIDAIPVEWIKARWEKGWCKESVRCVCEQWLIEDWQEEQEAQYECEHKAD